MEIAPNLFRFPQPPLAPRAAFCTIPGETATHWNREVGACRLRRGAVRKKIVVTAAFFGLQPPSSLPIRPPTATAQDAVGWTSGGAIAQLVERLNGIQEVRGSTPLGSTNSHIEKHQIVLPFSSGDLPLPHRPVLFFLRRFMLLDPWLRPCLSRRSPSPCQSREWPMSDRFFVVTGGPGAGKTSLTTAIADPAARDESSAVRAIAQPAPIGVNTNRIPVAAG